MSKFKKKGGGELPPISTASLPDIVFMLLFFFMVATVLRKNNIKVDNQLAKADQVEKLDKQKTVFIYIGKPKAANEGKEPRVQIGDKYVAINEIKDVIFAEINEKIRPEFQDKVSVAMKIDGKANVGVVADVKKELREANLPKVIYITAAGSAVE